MTQTTKETPMQTTTQKQMKSVAILKEFFGLKEGQTNIQFLQELKELSGEERRELATLAAAQMGVELVD
jgi:hypothetical protein